jgi:hypothetical protein
MRLWKQFSSLLTDGFKLKEILDFEQPVAVNGATMMQS